MIKKKVLIIGASGDIGQAIAWEFANKGSYDLYLHYNKNENAIDAFVEKCKNLPLSIKKVQANFEASADVFKVTKFVSNVDIIVLASGVSDYGLVTDLSDEKIMRRTAHFSSLFMLVKELIPPMISKKSGNILFISSIWGEIGGACEVLYSSLTGAINTFVKSLSKEVAPSQIRVNAIAPGAIKTKMLDIFSNDELYELKNNILLKRLGTPKNIADAVMFLTSEDSSYITGQVIGVNGGWN